MCIIQITDIHISGPDERPFDVDVRKQFLDVLQEIEQHAPECMVLSGDLCFMDPSDEVYAWIAQQLKDKAYKIYFQPGNHDGQNVMQRHFMCNYHSDTDEIYFNRIWNDFPVLFLDTARGEMSEAQYAWMTKHLSEAKKSAILFMHHPPHYCGVPHMDRRYAFRQIPRLQQILTSTKLQFHIFCGHYHVERTLKIAKQEICITPSTFYQIDSTTEEFKIDHHRPGYRVIDLEKDGRIQSTCHYLL